MTDYIHSIAIILIIYTIARQTLNNHILLYKSVSYKNMTKYNTNNQLAKLLPAVVGETGKCPSVATVLSNSVAAIK